jgi:hypothetical protein
MSGGSYDYICDKVERECVDNMHDLELDEMMKDLCNVLHDLEWWKSDDIDEEGYRMTVFKFKEKWFGPRDKELRKRICEQIDKLKKEIFT